MLLQLGQVVLCSGLQLVFTYGSSSHRSSLDDHVVFALWIAEGQMHSLAVLAKKMAKSWDALDFHPADERWVLI